MGLTLTRRRGDTIVIPNLGITIRVTKTGLSYCRIEVEAPAAARILRGEVSGAMESLPEIQDRKEVA
jgi:sRNA-binding carbon storage regulator CsrA